MRELFYRLNKDERVTSKLTLYSFYSDLIIFFSKDSAIEIVNKHEKATDEYYNGIYNDIVYKSEEELLARIKETDSELVFPYISIFLWKQRLGVISEKIKLTMEEELIRNLVSDYGEYVVVRIYIMMALSGYE